MPTTRECSWCGQHKTNLKCCSKCHLVDYCDSKCQQEDWNNGGHKILCAKVPKAVAKAQTKIESFSLDQYTTQNIGTFWVTEAEAERGRIVEEYEAQDMCYDAWEIKKGSEKLEKILATLKHFPLSVEGWGTLGRFYRWGIKSYEFKATECSREALKMYDTAILCARKLNPTWTEDRTLELPWGEIDNRPYLRALSGRALALKDLGRVDEAVRQTKKLLRWDPDDGQGMRRLMCTWYLEIGDTEGCTNLLRKYNTSIDTSMAYTDVLLQFLRWKKDDVVEKDVQHALYIALKNNPFVPDVITAEIVKKVQHDTVSPGGIREAENYGSDARKLWNRYPDSVKWLLAQKYDQVNGAKTPTEMDLISLLRSSVNMLISSIHTNLEGGDKVDSSIVVTQKRRKCFGSGSSDFFWPPALDQRHRCSAEIFFHNNGCEEQDYSKPSRWRKTKYIDVKEVPYWNILIRFYEDDAMSSGSKEDSDLDLKQVVPKVQQLDLSSTMCKKCSSPCSLCVIGEKGTSFYCCEFCMQKDFGGSEPLCIDLNSAILEIKPSQDSTLRTLDIDAALTVAAERMPNIISVDIFIHQEYILSNNFDGDDKKSLVLSSTALRNFLVKTAEKLESFSLRLDDCCWDRVKKMTEAGKALLPLGTMPNLTKLTLGSFGFDDINVLVSCISPKLRVLKLDYIKLRSSTWCIPDVTALVAKISKLGNLATLSLADNVLTDKDLDCLLSTLKGIRCLNVSGKWGDSFEVRHSLLTDSGLKCIARHCPKLQSLDVSHQSKASTVGIRAVVNGCPGLLELEASDVKISTRDVKEILVSAKSLLFLRFDNKKGGVPSHEHYLIQDAIRATQGRTLVGSFYCGLYDADNLSTRHKNNREASKVKVESAFARQSDPKVYSIWEGV